MKIYGLVARIILAGSKRLKIKAIILFLFILFPSLGFSEGLYGAIFGSIKIEEGIEPPKDAQMLLNCEEESPFGVIKNVDIPGSFELEYKIKKRKSSCILTINLDEMKYDFEVKIFEMPRRHDFFIYKDNGKYVIKRR